MGRDEGAHTFAQLDLAEWFAPSLEYINITKPNSIHNSPKIAPNCFSTGTIELS